MHHRIAVLSALVLCSAATSALAQGRRPTRPGLRAPTGTTPPPAPVLAGFTLSVDSISGGPGLNQPNGKVTLSGAAPAGGLVVTLSSNSAAATVPASITVPAGATDATFQVTTAAVSTPTAVHVTANAGSASVTDTLKVLLGVVSVVSEGWVPGSNGTQRTYRVTMSGPVPPGGLSLIASLATAVPSSYCSPVPVFSSVVMPVGATSGVLTVTTDRSMLNQWHWQIRYVNRVHPQPVLHVAPAHIGAVTIPSTLATGTTGYGTVQTTMGSTVSASCMAQYPAWYNHEYTVYFSSSNSAVVQVPVSGLVSPAQNQLSFALTASPTTTQQTATITVSKRAANGPLVAIKQVTVTVTP